jgi:putative ABC transport system permease protein
VHLGLALAVGVKQLLETIGFELPSGGIVFSWRTIVVSLAVGTLITLLASLRPALRASRIEPIAAVREARPMSRCATSFDSRLLSLPTTNAVPAK